MASTYIFTSSFLFAIYFYHYILGETKSCIKPRLLPKYDYLCWSDTLQQVHAINTTAAGVVLTVSKSYYLLTGY